jgi:hypothetical protein
MLTDLIIHQNLNTTKYEPFVHFIEAPAPELSEIQSTAIDLHSRGLNIAPVMKHSKKPFVLEPLFHTRLHHCTDLCRHRGSFNVAELFTRRNIGLMTGKTSGNLFDIDCDSQEAFTRIGEELSARGILFWAVSTASGGRYLLRCKEGEVQNMPKTQSNFDDVEIWGNRHMVVVPPSIHPSGAFYQWVTPEPRLNLPAGEPPPVVSIRSLEFLGVTLRKKTGKAKQEEPALKNLPGWAKKLSRRNLQTILNAPDEGTRNNRLFALACDLKANGVDYGEAEAVVLDIARRAGTEDYEAVSTLKSAYSEERTAARNHYGTNPKGERSEDWKQAMEFAKSYDWRATFGRKANSRRKVFFALVERAKLEGRDVFRATSRELAEMAGTDRAAITRTLQDLEGKGLIVRVLPERKNYVPNQPHGKNGKLPGLYRFAGYAKQTPREDSVINFERTAPIGG